MPTSSGLGHAVVPFEHRHADDVAALCASESWPSWTSDTVSAAFSAPGVIAVVAEHGDRVVGAAQLLTDGAVMGYLGVLVVAADMRGLGLGRALVAELFRRSGLSRLDLLSEVGSRAFYESMPHKTKPGYRLYRDPR